MMNTAIVCGLIILAVLVVLLLAGVPIAVALGLSSICAILPIMDTGIAVVTGAQRIFPVFPYSACWQSRFLSWQEIL